jgi:hypothetical protein
MTIAFFAAAPAAGAGRAHAREAGSAAEPLILAAADGRTDDQFGSCVALEQGWLAAGSLRHHPDAPLGQGAVYLHEYAGAGWPARAKLIANDGAPGDYLGQDCDFSGPLLVAGAPRRDEGGKQDSGAAYLFRLTDGAWTQEMKLFAPDAQPSDNFGGAVLLAEPFLFVGAPHADVGGSEDQGAVYVFLRDGAVWRFHSKLVFPGGGNSARFGDRLNASGDRLLVGAPGHSAGGRRSRGAALIFLLQDGAWAHETTLLAPDGAQNDEFGSDVALDGLTAVVGADHDDRGSPDQGSVYTFVFREGWAYAGHFTGQDTVEDSYFGESVALRGDALVVGAWGHSTNGQSRQGMVYRYARAGDGWRLEEMIAAPDGAPTDWFGRGIAFDGYTTAIAALRANISPHRDAGKVYVYGRPVEIATGFRGWLPVVEK